MANIKSSQKDMRRIKRRTQRNQEVSSTLKTLRKKLVLAADSKEQTKESLDILARKYCSALDKAAKRSIIHQNKASRLKSACSKYAAARA